MMAAPITSPGRFSPRGPLGIVAAPSADLINGPSVAFQVVDYDGRGRSAEKIAAERTRLLGRLGTLGFEVIHEHGDDEIFHAPNDRRSPVIAPCLSTASDFKLIATGEALERGMVM
jgi:hypothetical protein